VRRPLGKLWRLRQRCGSWSATAANIIGRIRESGVATVLKASMRQPLVSNQPSEEGPQELRVAVKMRLTGDMAPVDVKTTDRTFSILMPVYRPRIDELRAAIDSVLRQTAPWWELCIVVDGGATSSLSNLLNASAAKDSRVRYLISDANEGISAATNRAFRMSTGSFVLLMDQDDLLSADAIEIINDTIQAHPDADFLYSDEVIIDSNDDPIKFFLKPDWSPCFLLSSMYTGHLSCYRRSFVENIGSFRSEYDLSQDYDLALRASESTENIFHIPQILYGWRASEGSASVGGKPQARDSNKAALQAALSRRGITGTIVEDGYVNRIQFEPKPGDLVSIIIPSDNYNHISNTINALLGFHNDTSTEIIVVTNSSLCKKLPPRYDSVRFIPFDAKFNFSAKCNLGAKHANGNILLFLNDDVSPNRNNWLDAFVGTLAIPNVGAVSPRLIYSDERLQFAGMVTGVRSLVGSALHGLPVATSLNLDMAQHMREVSILSGACLAIYKSIYDRLGGFDETHFPIAHSDIDLSFKVRAAGLRCVYNPASTLTHIGHASFETGGFVPSGVKDPADALMIARWPGYTSYDPYFTPAMAKVLYTDSPEPFEIFPGKFESGFPKETLMAIVSDLERTSHNGAIARYLAEKARTGSLVVLASPVDGPMRAEMLCNGLSVIVDQMALVDYRLTAEFVQAFETVLFGTLRAAQLLCRTSSFIRSELWVPQDELDGIPLGTYHGAYQALGCATVVKAPTLGLQKFLAAFSGQVGLQPFAEDQLAGGRSPFLASTAPSSL